MTKLIYYRAPGLQRAGRPAGGRMQEAPSWRRTGGRLRCAGARLRESYRHLLLCTHARRGLCLALVLLRRHLL